MPPVPGRLMGRIIIVTVQQTCHCDRTKGDFSSTGPGQVTLSKAKPKRMTDICWMTGEMKRKKKFKYVNAHS